MTKAAIQKIQERGQRLESARAKSIPRDKLPLHHGNQKKTFGIGSVYDIVPTPSSPYMLQKVFSRDILRIRLIFDLAFYSDLYKIDNGEPKYGLSLKIDVNFTTTGPDTKVN